MAITLDGSNGVKSTKLTSNRDPNYVYLDFVDSATANDTNGDMVLSAYYPIVFKTDLEHERMRIDRQGRVTMPYQPAFLAQAVASDTTYGVGVIPYQGVILNKGGHYNSSNSRFTAPVSGVYQFTWSGWHNTSTTGTGRMYVRVNGSYVKASGYSSSHGIHVRLGDTATDDDSTASVILQLSAGDYVDIYNGESNVVLFHAQCFSGHLLG